MPHSRLRNCSMAAHRRSSAHPGIMVDRFVQECVGIPLVQPDLNGFPNNVNLIEHLGGRQRSQTDPG